MAVCVQVTPLITELGRTRMEVNTKVKAGFSNKLFALNVVITIPVPDTTASADMQTSIGEHAPTQSSEQMQYKESCEEARLQDDCLTKPLESTAGISQHLHAQLRACCLGHCASTIICRSEVSLARRYMTCWWGPGLLDSRALGAWAAQQQCKGKSMVQGGRSTTARSMPWCQRLRIGHVHAGKAKYDSKKHALVWKIKKFTGATEHSLVSAVELIATTREKKSWSRPPHLHDLPGGPCMPAPWGMDQLVA